MVLKKSTGVFTYCPILVASPATVRKKIQRAEGEMGGNAVNILCVQ